MSTRERVRHDTSQPIIDVTGEPTIDLTRSERSRPERSRPERPLPESPRSDSPRSDSPGPPAALPRIVPLSILLAAVVGLSGMVSAWTSGPDGASAVRPDVSTAPLVPAPSPTAASSVSASVAISGAASSGAAAPSTVGPSSSADASTPASAPSVAVSQPATAANLTAADLAAGLTSLTIPEKGSGKLVTVPGDEPAAGKGTVKTFRVQVEKGLPIDGQRFADFVYRVLNDPRSWGAGGRMTFARTDGASDFRIVLASPQTSAAMCRPLRTGGTLSCRKGSSTILTAYRWAKGTPDYGTNLTGYRQYVVNHEVGHYLGHHKHLPCPGAGRPAPVMMQQTKGLNGCSQNPWPFP